MNMVIRIIKTKTQHKAALAEIARLVRRDPAPESRAGLRLELLAKLVEDYEAERFVFAKPDPIDAILFRMDERGLRQRTWRGHWAERTARRKFWRASGRSSRSRTWKTTPREGERNALRQALYQRNHLSANYRRAPWPRGQTRRHNLRTQVHNFLIRQLKHES
jgi:hypothetical protein